MLLVSYNSVVQVLGYAKLIFEVLSNSFPANMNSGSCQQPSVVDEFLLVECEVLILILLLIYIASAPWSLPQESTPLRPVDWLVGTTRPFLSLINALIDKAQCSSLVWRLMMTLGSYSSVVQVLGYARQIFEMLSNSSPVNLISGLCVGYNETVYTILS